MVGNTGPTSLCPGPITSGMYARPTGLTIKSPWRHGKNCKNKVVFIHATWNARNDYSVHVSGNLYDRKKKCCCLFDLDTATNVRRMRLWDREAIKPSVRVSCKFKYVTVPWWARHFGK